MELIDWSLLDRLFAGDACLRNCREIFTRAYCLILPLSLIFSHVCSSGFKCLCISKWLFLGFFGKYLGCKPWSSSSISIFVLRINDLADRLDAAKRHFQTSHQCTWDILYTGEMLQEGAIDYKRCLPGKENMGEAGQVPCYQGLVPHQLSPVMRHVHMCWHGWARTQRRRTAFCRSSWESGT